MQHVANNHDPLTSQRFKRGGLRVEMARQGEEIQQGLAGVAVQAITGIEHRRAAASRLKIPGQLRRHTRAAVTHHQHIGAHSHIGAGGIEQAFAFG